MEELLRAAGTQLDPRIVRMLVEVIERQKASASLPVSEVVSPLATPVTGATQTAA